MCGLRRDFRQIVVLSAHTSSDLRAQDPNRQLRKRIAGTFGKPYPCLSMLRATLTKASARLLPCGYIERSGISLRRSSYANYQYARMNFNCADALSANTPVRPTPNVQPLQTGGGTVQQATATSRAGKSTEAAVVVHLHICSPCAARRCLPVGMHPIGAARRVTSMQPSAAAQCAHIHVTGYGSRVHRNRAYIPHALARVAASVYSSRFESVTPLRVASSAS